MASPSVVLHLGAHKTGTSVVQKFMGQRPREMARWRLAALPRPATSEGIGWGAVPSEHPERLREAVLATARRRLPVAAGVQLPGALSAVLGSAPRTVIVSHENALGRPFGPGQSALYPFAGDCASGLARSVGDLTQRVVYYLRSQDEFLESYYLQTVHQGGTAAFDAWLSTKDTTAISWAPVVEALERVFGADRLVLRDFAQIRSGQNAFIENFLRTCDPRVEPKVDYHPLRNISISQRGLDLALVMNPLLRTSEERHECRAFLQKHFNNTTGPRPVLLSDEARQALQERYAAENRELIARHSGSGSRPAGS